MSLADARLRQEGFTLVELLVALAAGMVVISALVSLLIFVLHDSQRTFTRIDATRQARMAIATLENELHSACVGNNTAPIQSGSTASSLSFLSYTGDSLVGYTGTSTTNGAQTPVPTWHTVTLSGGQLTDTTWPTVAVTGSDGSVSWQKDTTNGGTAGATRVLLGNASALSGTAVFQYFAYQAFQSATNSSQWYWTIPDGTNPQPTGTLPASTGTAALPASSQVSAQGQLGTAAPNIVEVGINLSVGASTNSLSNGSMAFTATPISDIVSLRLSSPPASPTASTSPGSFGPCQ